MTNKHPGNCETCRTRVAAGQGELRKIAGRWIVLCAAHGTTPAVAAAQVVLSLVIRVWIAAGRVLCAPVSRLNGSFDTYLAATRAVGAGYSKADNAQVCTLAQAPALIDALRAAGFVADVSPELVGTLQARQAQVASEINAAQGRVTAVDAALRERGLGVFPFQSLGIDWLAPRGKAVLADDMGLGKTIQALTAAPVGAPLLVICPAVAKGVWVREAKRFRPDLTPVALSGRGSFRWPVAGEMVIINYDILPHVEDPTTIKAKKGAAILGRAALERKFTQPLRFGETLWTRIGNAMIAEHTWWKAFTASWERVGLRIHGEHVLAAVPANCVVIADEAHALKGSKASRTHRFRALSKVAIKDGGRTWLLTATPIENRAPELWAILQAMDAGREVFGSWKRFMQLWNAEQGRYGIIWGSPTPEVATALRTIMLRRMKREVLTQLPPKTIRTIEVNGLSASTKALCDRAFAVFETHNIDLAKAAAMADATANHTVAFEQISAARAALATAKLASALELVESFEDAEEPVVVFSAHVAPLKVLGAREGWALITGDTSADKRTAIQDAFQAGQLKGVACSIKAGGVAITLTRAANALFIDEEWTPSKNSQAQDRIYRIGQSRGVVITRLVASHALDRRIAELLAEKTEIIENTVDAARVGATEAGPVTSYAIDTAAVMTDSERAIEAEVAVLQAEAAMVQSVVVVQDARLTDIDRELQELRTGREMVATSQIAVAVLDRRIAELVTARAELVPATSDIEIAVTEECPF